MANKSMFCFQCVGTYKEKPHIKKLKILHSTKKGKEGNIKESDVGAQDR